MKKIDLIDFPPEISNKVGYLILLFAQVEWLVANTLLLSEIKADDYSKLKKIYL